MNLLFFFALGMMPLLILGICALSAVSRARKNSLGIPKDRFFEEP